MIDALLSAIQDGRPWLDRFTRREYEKAFAAYVAQYGDPCREAIRGAGDGEGPAERAEALVDALAEGRKRTPFWNRTARGFDEKQMVIVYFSPMLLELGEEEFARSLREAWARRWPKDSYELATSQELRKGFRRVIMGITLREKDK